VVDGRVYLTVWHELRRLKPDLAHIMNVSGATLAPYLACQNAHIPVVNTLHDLWLLCPNNMLYRKDGTLCNPSLSTGSCGQCYRRYDFWGNIPYRRRVFAWLTSNVRMFISPSQALIDRHVEAGYDPRRFRLVPYGYEEQPFVPQVDSSPLRGIIETASHYHTVTYAGGGIEIKGAQTVIDAIPLLLRHDSRLRVVVAGSGEASYLELFGQYSPRVCVIGRVPFQEMLALYAASDLVLVPSVCHENSPTVTHQSFQMGTPVVGSALGGTPESILEGETGYVFPPRRADVLAEKVLLHFARPPVTRRRMSRRCLEEARTRFSIELCVARVLQAYHEALA